MLIFALAATPSSATGKNNINNTPAVLGTSENKASELQPDTTKTHTTPSQVQSSKLEYVKPATQTSSTASNSTNQNSNITSAGVQSSPSPTQNQSTTTSTPAGNYIPYAGNGRGPTVCADGSISHSSGRGTCSHHGGIAK